MLPNMVMFVLKLDQNALCLATSEIVYDTRVGVQDRVLVAQRIERPLVVREVMGSNRINDSFVE